MNPWELVTDTDCINYHTTLCPLLSALVLGLSITYRHAIASTTHSINSPPENNSLYRHHLVSIAKSSVFGLLHSGCTDHLKQTHHFLASGLPTVFSDHNQFNCYPVQCQWSSTSITSFTLVKTSIERILPRATEYYLGIRVLWAFNQGRQWFESWSDSWSRY